MGFGVVDHWCQMRGHSKVPLLNQEVTVNTCEANEPMPLVSSCPAVKKLPCCKTTLSYEHLDVSRFVADQHNPAAPQPAEFIPNPRFRLLLAALLPIDAQPSAASMADDPLPRTGRFRLTVGCSWLI